MALAGRPGWVKRGIRHRGQPGAWTAFMTGPFAARPELRCAHPAGEAERGPSHARRYLRLTYLAHEQVTGKHPVDVHDGLHAELGQVQDHVTARGSTRIVAGAEVPPSDPRHPSGRAALTVGTVPPDVITTPSPGSLMGRGASDDRAGTERSNTRHRTAEEKTVGHQFPATLDKSSAPGGWTYAPGRSGGKQAGDPVRVRLSERFGRGQGAEEL